MLFKDWSEGSVETAEHHKVGVLIYRYLLERGE